MAHVDQQRAQTIATGHRAPDATRPPLLGLLNAPIRWGGATWSAYMWGEVVSRPPRERNELFLHELFQCVQPRLGLTAASLDSEHLDAADGRYVNAASLAAGPESSRQRATPTGWRSRRLRRLQKRAGSLQLRTLGFRRPGDVQQGLIQLPRLRAIAARLRRSRGAVGATESSRLLRHRRLECDERLASVARLEQHLAEQLARRRERSGGNGRLVGRVLTVRRRAQEGDAFVPPPFSEGDPRQRDASLNVHLLAPVVVVRQLVAQRRQAVDVQTCSRRFAAPGRAERAR